MRASPTAELLEGSSSLVVFTLDINMPSSAAFGFAGEFFIWLNEASIFVSRKNILLNLYISFL